MTRTRQAAARAAEPAPGRLRRAGPVEGSRAVLDEADGRHLPGAGRPPRPRERVCGTPSPP